MKRFYILAIWLLPTDAQAGTPPTGVLMAGTVRDSAAQKVESGGGYATCALNSQLTGNILTDQGPLVSFWQQDVAGGPVTLTFPSLGRALTNAAGATTWSYYSAGAARLIFGSSTSGTISVPSPGNLVTGGGLNPSFGGFTQSYNAATGALSVQFTITMGDCSIPFVASYQG